jgi:hypothetical protein
MIVLPDLKGVEKSGQIILWLRYVGQNKSVPVFSFPIEIKAQFAEENRIIIMEKVFRTRPDWFKVKIVPAIRRRTFRGAIVLALCFLAWAYFKSWIPVVIGAVVIGERLFELASIPSARKVTGSLSIAVTKAGLSCRGAGIQGHLLYPWSSLNYKIKRTDDAVESITIQDMSRKRSKVKLVGFEEMGELASLIERNAGES